MREIKFRAWNKRDKVMEYDVNVNQGKPVKQGCQWFNTENTETVYHSALQQYTGLKDKNGKEIYERDIVSYFGLKYEVLFKNGAFGWMEDGEFYSFSQMTHSVFDEFEVIGNAYENPELLGEIEMNRWMETAKKVLGRGKIW